MTKNKGTLTLLAILGISAPFCGDSLSAGESGKLASDAKAPIDAKAPVDTKPPADEGWKFCNIFDDKFLYKDGDGFLKSLRFLGRYHGQFTSEDEEFGDKEGDLDEYQSRRFRLGFEAKFALGLSLYSELNIADGRHLTTDTFFNDHHDTYVKWEPSKEFWMLAGKTKQQLTREDTESSKKIKVLERSPIVNEVAGARPWGILTGLTTGDFKHQLGAWLYGAHEDAPRWVDFDSNGGFSYNLAYALMDTTSLHFDYAYSDNDGGRSSSRGKAAFGYGSAYEHGFALGTAIENKKFQLISDFVVGLNGERSKASGGSHEIPAGHDTWGFYVLPSYDIAKNTELVFRYGYMAEGREQNPQRNISPRQNVENYHSIYLGFQHFICKEKFKVMGGYEYTVGKLYGTNTDINGGSWQIGFRTYW